LASEGPRDLIAEIFDELVRVSGVLQSIDEVPGKLASVEGTAKLCKRRPGLRGLARNACIEG
jgi:hypothetical protein